MSNRRTIVASLDDPLQDIVRDTPWPLILVSADGQILALSEAMRDLLGADESALVDTQVGLLVREEDRPRLAAALARNAADSPLVRVQIKQAGSEPVEAEIQAIAIDGDPLRRVTLIVYLGSLAHRREQFMLELNRVAPCLLTAQSAEELFAITTQALKKVYLRMAVLLEEPARGQLVVYYIEAPAGRETLLHHATGLYISQIGIPARTPPYDLVLGQHRTVFWPDFRTVIQATMPPQAAQLAELMLRLEGSRGFIAAPIAFDERDHGVLLIWGHALTERDVLFVEAYAHHLTAVLAQIGLRRRMEAQMQRLKSLAITARAVTTLGTLDDVLRVICVQAQELLEAEFASINQPSGADVAVVYATPIDGAVDQVVGSHFPKTSSISGQVIETGRGVCIDDLAAEAGTHQPLVALQQMRSALFQPLTHQGSVLGVLIVGHREPSYYSQADLDDLARYAEYAAVAIANAQLHGEQQRQQHALAALLRVSEAINSSLDLDTMLHAGLHALDELGLATMAGVSLLNPEETHIEMRAHLRVPQVMVTNFGRLELAHLGVVRRALQTGEIQVLTPGEIARYYPTYPGIETVPLNSSIFVPLIADGRPLGTLNVGHIGQPYTEHNLQLLQTIAHQLAQAVVKAQSHQSLLSAAAENAQLYREAESMRSYLDTLIRTSPDVLLIVRRDLTLRPLNIERARTLWGYLPNEILGAGLHALVPKPYHDDMRQCLASAEQGQPRGIEIELNRADRSRARVLISCAFLPEYDETLAVCKDVTEQRQIEDQMRQNEKLAALGQMVAGAAHELNNPLAIILGLAQLQRGAGIPSAMQMDMKGIEDAAMRARAIVQQLLTFARRSRPQPQPVDLAPLIHATLARMAQSLEANAIQTVIDIPDDRCVISGDLDQIEQVLFNILNNAVQALATNQPAAPRELRISAECDGDNVHLAIVDSGPGIAPDHLPHIFDPFFTTRSIGEGTGLGLAIVHAIVQQHRGRVWAQNNPERGMTLHVQLRAAESEEPRVAEGRHGPTKSGARILVVDDEELIRTVVRRMLAEHSFLVDAVASGEEALGCAQGQDYDLILCDLHMPGLDGQALYQRLHQLRPSQRWLILTGDTMGEPSRAFLERTGLPVLAKPFTQDQLLECVAECIGAANH